MSHSKILSICLTLYLLASFTLAEGVQHNCIHDSEYQEPGLMDVDELLHHEEEHRVLSSTGFPNIRLATNYEYLTGGTASFRSYVENDLVPPVVAYFQNALKIKNPLKTNLKVTAGVSKVCQYTAPTAIRTTGVAADHFFFFTADAESNNFVATAMYCQLATDTKRPVISRVKLNLNYLTIPNGNALTHEANTYVLMHEMTHSFGFSYNLYQHYIDANGNTLTGHIKKVNLDGNTRTVLDVSALTTRARNYFGCASLPGIYMEQNGDASLTANSHLERKFFLMDMMTNGVINSARTSEFSLGVLEASGWYSVNYAYAEPMWFGAGQGCGFINNKCGATSAFEEFCTVSRQRACFTAGRGGGFCESDATSDGCMYHSPSTNFDCHNPKAASQAGRMADVQVFGPDAGSKCFDGTLSTVSGDKSDSFCFQYQCVASGSSKVVTVQVGNRKVTCTQAGKVTVPGYQGTLNCPDPVAFCSTVGAAYCQRNCMGRGVCSKGKCICNSGFTGNDCSERV